MSAPALDSAPRIAALPGPSRLVRISEDTWQDLRHRLSPADSPAADVPDPRSIAELVRTGLLVDGDIEPHWRAALSAALASPVSVRLVCVDRDRAWTSDLLVAGELVVVLDQVREVSSDDDSVRLGRRSSAVLLGLTTLEWLSATVEALIPQHPAFVPALADSAAADSGPAPSTGPLADAPAVAEVQVLLTTAPVDDAPAVRGRSWYALGEDAGVLATVTGDGDARHVEQAPPGALTTGIMGDLLTALRQASVAARTETDGSTATEAGR